MAGAHDTSAWSCSGFGNRCLTAIRTDFCEGGQSSAYPPPHSPLPLGGNIGYDCIAAGNSRYQVDATSKSH